MHYSDQTRRHSPRAFSRISYRSEFLSQLSNFTLCGGITQCPERASLAICVFHTPSNSSSEPLWFNMLNKRLYRGRALSSGLRSEDGWCIRVRYQDPNRDVRNISDHKYRVNVLSNLVCFDPSSVPLSYSITRVAYTTARQCWRRYGDSAQESLTELPSDHKASANCHNCLSLSSGLGIPKRT